MIFGSFDLFIMMFDGLMSLWQIFESDMNFSPYNIFIDISNLIEKDWSWLELIKSNKENSYFYIKSSLQELSTGKK
jgi:hypothetical protein